MRLSEWMGTVKANSGDVARALGISSRTVAHWLAGDGSPSLVLALAIERMTAGEVRPADLLTEQDAVMLDGISRGADLWVGVLRADARAAAELLRGGGK